MGIHYEDQLVTLHHGDCLDVLRGIPDNSIDAVVCDPPYGLSNTDPAHVADTIIHWVNGERDYLPPVRGGGFMGNAWDSFVPPVAVWDECYRVLKPGGHVLTFAGSRTHDLMALGVRLAGFDIRDSIAWLYGSGFPKSLDVARAIDAHQKHGGSSSIQKRKAAMGDDYTPSEVHGQFRNGHIDTMNTPRSTAPEQAGERTPDAERGQGWGTALKPAFEPIVVGRKPLDGTVAANVLRHGTGALNVDGCRVASSEADKAAINAKHAGMNPDTYERSPGVSLNLSANPMPLKPAEAHAGGRWPTNVVLDGHQADELDEQSGECSHNPPAKWRGGTDSTEGWGNIGKAEPGATRTGFGDTGGASRFFPVFRYEAKAPTSQRPKVDGVAHPTVKPLDLMRWLVRLVTPPGGTVLEPFAGSGTTVEACVIEGFKCIAIEKTDEYLPLTVARIHRQRNPVEAIRLAGEDLGLFDLGEETA